ncbi:hypothetical protein NEMBOFW57_002042 [Staphylotrichum longicolle]|uniref:Uncharacterized protein n=1 Tax=Staphylotrichum longicolle TaxID=669026 RepID=A0AAD4F2R3_9PEZI|nr:hypothetical protein NEMBOFW57_002042 [Staphylotrichum longicolle]
MPPPIKRSYATANLDNGASPASKRRRPIEVIVLSSDSESDDEVDPFDIPPRAVLEGDDDEDENRFGAEEVEEYETFEEEDEDEDEDVNHHDEDDVEEEYDANEVESHDDDNGSQDSQPRRSLTILEQLQQDAFSDLKLDLRLELDELRPRAKEDTSDDAGDSEKAAADGLRCVLPQWLDQDKMSRCSNHLFYRLDAKYSEKQFPPQVFDGRDQAIVETLCELAAEFPLEIFFALLDRDDSDSYPSYLVRHLADRQGHDLVLDIAVDEQSWLQTKLPSLKARAPDCEAAVVLVPRDSMVDSLLPYVEPPSSLLTRPSSIKSLQALVTYFLDTISEEDNRNRLFPAFKELCVRVWQLDQTKGLAVLPEDLVNSILKAVVDAQDWGFLEAAASHLGGRPHMGFFYWVGEKVAANGLLLAPLEKRYADNPSSSGKGCKLTVLEFINRRTHFHDLL